MRAPTPIGANAASSASAGVPRDLREFAQWVGWDYRPTKRGLTKVPYRLPPPGPARGRLRPLVGAASTTDPSTWAPYELAAGHQRIGFVFTPDDPFCGVDLDDCLDPDTGRMSLVARVAFRYCASYAEVSPSGRGVKIIARARVPGERRKNSKLGVEMYHEGRFFTLTGNRLPDAPEHTTEVDLTPLYRWIFGPAQAAPAAPQPANETPPEKRILEKAFSAKNGARFERLWRGDASGYPTRSEADLALCAMLAYWSECDASTMELLFFRSGLCREKWRTRPDYRWRTIDRAIATFSRQAVS